MQNKNLGGFIFFCARIHAGPVFANAGRSFRGTIFRISLPNSWGNSFLRKYMQCLYSHLREYRKNSWRTIYVLVSCRGVLLQPSVNKLPLSEGLNRGPSDFSWEGHSGLGKKPVFWKRCRALIFGSNRKGPGYRKLTWRVPNPPGV